MKNNQATKKYAKEYHVSVSTVCKWVQLKDFKPFN